MFSEDFAGGPAAAVPVMSSIFLRFASPFPTKPLSVDCLNLLNDLLLMARFRNEKWHNILQLAASKHCVYKPEVNKSLKQLTQIHLYNTNWAIINSLYDILKSGNNDQKIYLNEFQIFRRIKIMRISHFGGLLLVLMLSAIYIKIFRPICSTYI